MKASRQDARPVDVARPELVEIADRDRLVAAGNVRERLERRPRAAPLDEVRPLGQRGQP